MSHRPENSQSTMSMMVEAHFGDFHQVIRKELIAAAAEIKIAVAWFSFAIYTPILLNLASRGVDIVVYCADEPSNHSPVNERQSLDTAGVKCILYKLPRKENRMHHKFAVIDRQTVLNGSFNWSDNAMKNFENLLVIRDEPQVARHFLAEFGKIEALDQAAIRALQAAKRCPRQGCPGKMVNILVFDPTPIAQTYESWGDLIQTCSRCGEESFLKLRSAVQDTSLFAHLTSHELITDASDARLQAAEFDLRRDLYLTGYHVDGHSIHAIGLVQPREFPDGTSLPRTRIIWKNKFIDAHIEDEYETSFGVTYSSFG